MKRKAIFIDKDGTLIPDIPYNVDPEKISISAGALQGLKLLQQNNYLLIIITNQSGIARGFFPEEDLDAVFTAIRTILSENGIRTDAFYYCPHHPEGKVEKYARACDCRKPLPGLILRAAEEFDIDLTKSWMIGDILNDVEAGHRAGCRAILIDNGNETEWLMNGHRDPDYKAKNIDDAARHIIKMNNRHETELAEL